MKTIKLLSLSLVATLLFSACSDDDDVVEVINEEEEITTLNVYLTPEGGTESLVFGFKDLDGGVTEPTRVNNGLQANTTYTGRMEFLNENEDPIEDKTVEIEEEDEEHQVFFIPETGLNTTIDELYTDGNGDPLGTRFRLVTGEASTGNLTFILIHEGDKSTPEADGETDIEVTFDVTIE
jgi:hypothetical protein